MRVLWRTSKSLTDAKLDVGKAEIYQVKKTLPNFAKTLRVRAEDCSGVVLRTLMSSGRLIIVVDVDAVYEGQVPTPNELGERALQSWRV